MRLRDHDPAELAFYSKELQISSSYSHSDGASFGALRIVQIMTSDVIRKFQDRILHTSMTRRMRNICHTLSSHHSVQTV